MINTLIAINKIKVETKADAVAVAVTDDNPNEFFLCIQKDEFEQQISIPLATKITVDGIVNSFHQSYADSQKTG